MEASSVRLSGSPPARRITSAASTPLRFEPAVSKTGKTAGFVARGPGYAIAVSPKSMRLALAGRRESHSVSVRMDVVGANPTAEGKGLEALPSKSHYLIGNDPDGWRRNVPHYSRVKFKKVYPGIDVIYRGLEREGSAGPARLEYDFIVAPGADPSLIELSFDGFDKLRLDDGGDLVLSTPAGELRQHRPVVYQHAAGERRIVEARFELHGTGRVGFSVGDYDANLPLVIDPEVVFGSYLGGDDFEALTRVLFDEATQQLLLAGWTFSPNFPANPETRFANFLGGRDGFVSALSADASTLLWTTFVGSPGVDVVTDLEAFEDILWMTGHTDDPRMPVTEPNRFVQRVDSFLLGLSKDGQQIEYGRYTGGTGGDESLAMDICRRDNQLLIVQAGRTDSPDFPVGPESAPHLGGFFDAFVEVQVLERFGPSEDLFMEERTAVYFGGIAEDEGKEVVITSCESETGPEIVMGMDTTSKGLFIGPLPFQVLHAGGMDAHLTAWRLLDPIELRRTGGTYVGGAEDETLEGMELTDSSYLADEVAMKRIALLLTTNSRKLPTLTSAIHILPGGEKEAMYVISLSGDELGSIFDTPEEEDAFWATYVGGEGIDRGGDLVVDRNGCIVVTGTTNSADYPVTPGAPQTEYAGGNWDAVVSRVCGYGTRIEFSTFLGGLGDERGTALAVDTMQQYYVGGETTGGFPTTPGVAQADFGGGSQDTFVTKLSNSILFRDGLVSAAKYTPADGGGISPQEIVTGFGIFPGIEGPVNALLSKQVILPDELGGVRVLTIGKPNPMFFASSSQVTFVARWNFKPPGPDPLQIEVNGDLGNTVVFPIAESNPGIFSLDFSGTGQGAILNPDFSVNGPGNPSDSFIIVFGTGGGRTDPICPNGELAPSVEPLPRLKLTSTAFVDGVAAEVLYAGSAPRLICGVNQWTVMPTNSPSGPAVPVTVCVGDQCSQGGITVAFE